MSNSRNVHVAVSNLRKGRVTLSILGVHIPMKLRVFDRKFYGTICPHAILITIVENEQYIKLNSSCIEVTKYKHQNPNLEIMNQEATLKDQNGRTRRIGIACSPQTSRPEVTIDPSLRPLTASLRLTTSSWCLSRCTTMYFRSKMAALMSGVLPAWSRDSASLGEVSLLTSGR